MTQMITSWHGSQRKTYCVECADSLPEMQAETQKAEDEGQLEISDLPEDAQGQECVSCHRPIDQVRAESRSYRMKVTITFECEIDVEAGSATQAQFFVSETLSTIHLDKSKDTLETELEENVTMAERARIDDCFYEVEPAKVVPPDQDADLP
jgi:hypothetical protein